VSCIWDAWDSPIARSLHYELTINSDCTGVDNDQETVNQLKDADVFNNIVVGDVQRLEELPIAPESFDVIVAGDIIEHISNPGKMLDGIHRLLKSNGALIISTPNSFGLPGFVRYVVGDFHEGRQHVLSFNAITLAQFLERHGYMLDACMTCHQRPTSTSLLFRAGKCVLQRFPRFGGTLLFVARIAGK
jgi:2-polyprenyl-3-methyl-5-hydroxy-6-metoxy-1,4-benzoquinol methylase